MQPSIDIAVMSFVQFAIVLGTCVLGVLFFWKLRYRRKPVLAWTLWVLAFGYSAAQLWRQIVFAYVAPNLMTIALGAVCVMVLTLYIAAIFYSPWPDPFTDDDPDDDDEKPFKIPDEV